MRLSHLFFASLRDDPADAEMPSHRLLLRAGYVRQLGSGIYSLLPLGFRVAQRDRADHPRGRGRDRRPGAADAGRPPGRHLARVGPLRRRSDPRWRRFKDRAGRDMVLAMTHEEVIADLLRNIVRSYRQLPVQLYHFQTKFRDEPRSRGRPDPRPRVHDEGRLLLRPRRGRPRRQLPGAVRRLRADLRAPRAGHDRGRRRTSG